MIEQAIKKASEKQNLSFEEAHAAMHDVMSGKASDVQIAALLIALRCKGETAAEISGSAQALTDVAVTIEPKVPLCVDPVGTGGDNSHSFNISSAAALLASAAGAHVAKHGNRSVSSRSGSADFFEALGFDLAQSPADACRSIEKYRFAFLYAPQYHPAMRHAAPVRSQLKLRTLFNLLGPIANPARAQATVLGVYAPHLLDFMAKALQRLGRKHALVVHSRDGMDEISLGAATDIRELKNGRIQTYQICPEDFGFKRCRVQDVAGGNARDNAAIVQEIFQGQTGPLRDVTLLNAAASVHVAGLVSGLDDGIRLCAQTIDQGRARAHLERLRKASAQDASKEVAG